LIENKNMGRKILIITGGPVRKLEAFGASAKELGLDVVLSSFSDLEFISESDKRLEIYIQGKNLSEFSLIYIRMVGKRLEDATLVVNYAKERGIRIVDRVYENSLFIPSTISKLIEMKKLIEAGLPLPKVYFGTLKMIGDKAPKIFSYPFVLKSTSGKKARDAWVIKSDKDFEEIFAKLREREKEGVRFFGQKLIAASERVRVLIVGGKVIGAIKRPTKWRKFFGGNQKEVREGLTFVPEKYSELAIKSALSVDLDIAGVDILEEDETKKLYVIEVNAAPSWKLVAKDCKVNVEKEILNFLGSL